MSAANAGARTAALAVGLALGFVADRLFGDPLRFHPVAGFGRVAQAYEQRVYAPDRARGALFCGTLVGGAAALGKLIERLGGPSRTLLTAAATWAVLGGKSLGGEAMAVYELAQSGDLPAARCRLKHLVGRDTSALDEGEIARAVIESVAENTADAVVGSLFWGAVAGAPGLLAHRGSNTLDAMVGHRTSRYEQFGWASARLDDLLGYLPARLTVALIAALGPLPDPAHRQRADANRHDRPHDQRSDENHDRPPRPAKGAIASRIEHWRRVAAAVCQDAAAHPSPNAGPIEAAFAAALGCRLGGTNTYGRTVENRGTLGDGPPAELADIPRAVALSRRIGWAALLTVTSTRLALCLLGGVHPR